MTIQRTADSGSTLLKNLLVIAAIIGILLMIAIPSYIDNIENEPVNNTTINNTGTSTYLDPVKKALKEMPWGNVAFNSPRLLGYGETKVVQLLLSGNKTDDQLLSLIEEDGNKETYYIKFNNDMQARLVGTAFEVTPITHERQAVSATGVAEWKWQIKAKELGEQKLFLTLNSHIEINGLDAKHTVSTLDKTINIEVVWPQSVKYFLWNYWQWIFTFVALPLFGFTASRIFRSKKSDKGGT